MATFKDSTGREWSILIDAPTVRMVRQEADFDLLADDACSRLAIDDLLCIDVFYLLCREQCQQREISDADFGRLMDGDTREAATAAFRQAYYGFFRPEKRSLLQSLSQRESELRAKAIELAIAKAANPATEREMMSRLEAKIDAAIQSIGATSATNSQAK